MEQTKALASRTFRNGVAQSFSFTGEKGEAREFSELSSSESQFGILHKLWADRRGAFWRPKYACEGVDAWRWWNSRKSLRVSTSILSTSCCLPGQQKAFKDSDSSARNARRKEVSTRPAQSKLVDALFALSPLFYAQENPRRLQKAIVKRFGPEKSIPMASTERRSLMCCGGSRGHKCRDA